MADLLRPFDAVRHHDESSEPTSLQALSHEQLLLVADGIGSGAGGQIASQLVVDTTYEYLHSPRSAGEKDLSTLGEIVTVLRRSQAEMSEASQRLSQKQIGTTVTAACILGSTLHVMHAGDSRCYLLRDGKLQRLTTDHNLAQQLVDEKFISATSAESSGLQHVLWNAVTADAKEFTLDTIARKLRDNDLLLLCTDGLTKHLTDADILAIADRTESPDSITRQLVDAAMLAGGTDNITVVVARYQSQLAAPVPPAAFVDPAMSEVPSSMVGTEPLDGAEPG